MANFKDAYADYRDGALKYEFITEISPDVWKISRKSDRMEYLAQDVTDTFFIDADSNPQKLTDQGQLLTLDGHGGLKMVKVVLNHPNLVSLVDFFALQFSKSGRLGRERWFTVWDYCDAGNLGNLFVPSQPLPQNSAPLPNLDREDEDVNMEDAPRESENREGPKFLPESFCWHVLTSVLRALSWLHDGVHDIVQRESGEWERRHEQVDWPPILHRNITPQNIFIGYPRRKEWYGPVKLGNYGQLVVSGHYPHPGKNEAPTFSKAIGPPPGQNVRRLGDLIVHDATYGSVYPRQPDQPYTTVSEYRALGEIIQAMMIEPTGSGHVERMQAQPARLNLREANYTGRLKNFVVKLMEFDPWGNIAEATQRKLTYVTSDLYCEAQQGVQWFLGTGNDEAKAYVASRTAEVEDDMKTTAGEAAQLFDSFRNVQDVLEQFT
ncbi:putative g2-specific serine threonine protein kinase protein [Rosellinia necatrix]|uniref:non-specific serine/threonine protein kinase n=1 Tax=Rosellinia necatrix TaxID=77044 RepID=A0A1W2TJE3_ROSNE|nr:putative g2-specific serine threonine protein kinase protein [Rosellinia necatrix]